MTWKFLQSLSCPFCKKSLSLKNSYFEKNGNLIQATVCCRCDVYPIVDGVLFLTKNKIKERATLFLEKGSFPYSYEVPIFLFRLPLGNFLTVMAVSFIARLNLFRKLPFKKFMKLFISLGIYEKGWGNYLLNRFDRKSFRPAVLSSSLAKKNLKVLDLGSGAGHLLYALKKRTKEKNLTAIEMSLPGIYLAKKYFCPEANYLYADLEHRLPFRRKSFNYVFVNDVFHYISNKNLLGKEIIRIIQKEGSVFLNVLHNIKFGDSFIDPIHFPDTPKGYASFFPGFKYSVFSEKDSLKGKLKYVDKKRAEGKFGELRTFTLILSKKELNRDIGLRLSD